MEIICLVATFNGVRFRAYVADTLVPESKPGDTAVFDEGRGRARRHRRVEARLLYLRLTAPPPKLASDRAAFRQAEALLRSAAARTIPDLWIAIREALIRFEAAEH